MILYPWQQSLVCCHHKARYLRGNRPSSNSLACSQAPAQASYLQMCLRSFVGEPARVPCIEMLIGLFNQGLQLSLLSLQGRVLPAKAFGQATMGQAAIGDGKAVTTYNCAFSSIVQISYTPYLHQAVIPFNHHRRFLASSHSRSPGNRRSSQCCCTGNSLLVLVSGASLSQLLNGLMLIGEWSGKHAERDVGATRCWTNRNRRAVRICLAEFLSRPIYQHRTNQLKLRKFCNLSLTESDFDTSFPAAGKGGSFSNKAADCTSTPELALGYKIIIFVLAAVSTRCCSYTQRCCRILSSSDRPAKNRARR